MFGQSLLSAFGSAAAFDPLQNFETVTYTGNGGTQKITGYIRKGAAFNGSSSKIETSYKASGSSTFSFSWWMYLTNTGNRNTIISDHRNTTNDDFTFFVEKEADNDLNIAIGNNNNSFSQGSVSITSYLNKWSHFVQRGRIRIN